MQDSWRERIEQDAKTPSESSEQSGSTLKEHDYIGMAEVSSAKTEHSNDSPGELNLKETDLCLGLGLALTPSKKTELPEDSEKTIAFTFSQEEGMPKTMVDANISARYAFSEGAPAEQRSLQWPNASMRSITGDSMKVPKVPPVQQGRDFQSSQMGLPMMQEASGAARAGNSFQSPRVAAHPSTLKNGVKRGYSEAMSDVARFNMTSEARAMGAMAVKSGEADVKALPKQPQNAFLPGWTPTKPPVATSWLAGPEQATAHAFGVNKAASVNRVEKSGADATATAFKGSHNLADAGQDAATNEAPPPKDRVVGWPPIRSYRKNTLARPMEMFVKVNMDGVTVGRKVDLNAHNSYDGLLSALEEMFQPSNNVQGGPQTAAGSKVNDPKHFRLLNGSDYVLTYEDKDGDWMLVGDVPWSMFTTTVRRLRITRGPEAAVPGPRGSEKVK
ncbi:hypothetical protein GOP47_0010769 [Adiantum capillus-veneris]|uniref:Auxin-responsive protein n=1 Tax=Adiantum capillus-veneris TaxID=13818 RepID=A0A9D4UWH4_ADICA|nr:hypothetical protein GOP47_0010769 [Adiantum capillus-veneris]